MYTNTIEYRPNILLCCDKNYFLSVANNIPCNIIGNIEIVDKNKKYDLIANKKLLFNEQIIKINEFVNKMRKNNIDYIVFKDLNQYLIYLRHVQLYNLYLPIPVSLGKFINMPHDFFYDSDVLYTLIDYFQKKNNIEILDYDGYFNTLNYFVKLDNVKIDGIIYQNSYNFDKTIYENIYENDIPNKQYDIILLTDKYHLKFTEIYNKIINYTKEIIIFTKRTSYLNNYINQNNTMFKYLGNILLPSSIIRILKGSGTKKYNKENLIKYIKQNQQITHYTLHPDFNIVNKDVCVYVIDHKGVQNDDKLPIGYRMLNVGKSASYNANGCLRENTGNNIHHLNKYLNELTAFYWIWKNRNNEIIGINHYRRFFTISNDLYNFSYDKIITKDIIINLLNNYDIIILKREQDIWTQLESIESMSDNNLVQTYYSILCKHLKEKQPECIDIFKYIMNSIYLYAKNMLITTREIFNKYCNWLFSFILDALNEIMTKYDLSKLPFHKQRCMGYFGERMLTVWLFKQNLKIKELNCLFNNEI